MTFLRPIFLTIAFFSALNLAADGGKLIIEDLDSASEVLEKRTVRILFAGDTHFNWGVRGLQSKAGRFSPIHKILPLFHSTDYRILNLETAVSDSGEPIKNKAHIFHSPPENIALLKQLRIDTVILSNNHAMDLGKAGLLATFENLRNAEIAFVGAGMDERDASAPLRFRVGAVNFAVFAFSEVGNSEIYASDSKAGVVALERNQRRFGSVRRAISKVRKKVDFVIVSMHWGHEYHTEPTPEQVELAHRLINAGVSLVVGHHPHVPQGLEIYKGGLIAYSLGNFVFGSANSHQTHNILLEVTFEKEQKKISHADIYPVWGTYKKGSHEVRLLKSNESNEFWSEFHLQSDRLNRKDELRLSVNRHGTGRLLIARSE